jgi:hypothetical protein
MNTQSLDSSSLHTIRIGNCEIKIAQMPHENFCSFRGDLDETFEHKKFPVLRGKAIRISLAQVANINSIGVREWVYLMREVSEYGPVILQECSVSFQDQINVVPQLLGKATVASFYAPYYCPTCEIEEACVIDTAVHRNILLARVAPEIKHHCGTPMEFDALEDSYFNQIERFYKS